MPSPISATPPPTVPAPPPAASPPANRAADAAWFRRVLGQYPTGVSVVTAIGDDGAPVGMTVGSFTSVSLEPPLVAFLPAASSSSWPKIAAAQRFCVNVLAADQEHVCRAFAARGADKFAGLGWHPAPSGAPILDEALAWIDCDLDTVHEAGDHLIVVGQVTDLHMRRSTLPLLFFQGGYGRFSPHSLATRDARFAAQLRLVDRVRPLMEDLARRTGSQVGAAFCDGHELTVLATAGPAPDERVVPAMIGQRLPVFAPVGIWWAAHATAEEVDEWLHHVDAPDLADRYRRALGEIRDHGYCLGLDTVYAEIDKILERREAQGGEPTVQERQALARLAVDPLDFVPSDTALSSVDDRGDVVSLWAPSFTADREVELGLFLSAAGPAHEHAAALRELADAITDIAAS